MKPIIKRAILVLILIVSVFSTFHFARQAQLVPDYVTSQSEWLRLDTLYTELVTAPDEDAIALEKWNRDFTALQTKKGDWDGLAHFSLYISLLALSLLTISFLKPVQSLRFRFAIRILLLAIGMVLTFFALADSFKKEALWGYYPSHGEGIGLPIAGSMVFCVFSFIFVLVFDSSRQRLGFLAKLNLRSNVQKGLAITGWFLFLASPAFGNGYIAGMAFFIFTLRGLIFPVHPTLSAL